MQNKLNTFDEVLKELAAHKLTDQIRLEETEGFSNSFENNGWTGSSTYSQTTGTGTLNSFAALTSLEHILAENNDKPGSNYAYDYGSFAFQYELKVGDRFPKIASISDFGKGQQSTLEPVPGVVLYIQLWETGCEASHLSMNRNNFLMDMHKEWTGKLQIVAINLDNDKEQTKRLIHDCQWKRISHYWLGWNKNHLVSRLGSNDLPFCWLINKAGALVYQGSPINCDIEEEVQKLICQQNPKIPLEPNYPLQIRKPQNYTLSEEFWPKFKHIIENPILIEGLQNVTLSTGKIRISSGSDIMILVEPLTVKYSTSLHNELQHQKLVESITKDLPQGSFQVVRWITDSDVILKTHRNKISSILQMHGFKQDLLIRDLNNLNLREELKWRTRRIITYPELSYKQDGGFQQGEAVMKDVNHYLELVKQKDISLIAHLKNKMPYRLFRNKFKGIYKLRSYNSNSKQTLLAYPGKYHFIVLGFNNDISQLHIAAFIDVAVKHPQKSHLHIIILDWTFPAYIQKLLTNKPPSISIYRANIPTTPDLRVANISSDFHTIIVDPEGIVLQNYKFNNYTALQRIVTSSKPILRGFPVSPAYADIIINFPSNPLAEQLSQQASQWNYPGVLKLFCYQQFSTNHTDQKVFGAKLQVSVREQHKPIVQPLIKLFEKEAQKNISFIKTFQLPLGKHCVDCKAELDLPYYYYHWSQCHRCLNCAEKQDKQVEQPSKRYSVNENAVLIFGDRNIDLKRLGNNIQPENDLEFINHEEFRCNSCSNGSMGEARYICLGCKRQPNMLEDLLEDNESERQGYVDLCYNCVRKLCKSPEKRQEVLEELIGYGDEHRESHALLRVLYSPRGYFIF